MIATNLRSSAINTFRSCPMSYFLEYNLGWDGGTGKAAAKGTVVHHVLELLGNLKKAQQDGKKSISKKSTGIPDLKSARLQWKNFLSTDHLIDKLTEQVYNYHADRYDHIKWESKDKKDCYKWVHKTLDEWNGGFDPRQQNIIEAEMFFDIELMNSWAKYECVLPSNDVLQGQLHIKGTIDLVTRMDDNTVEIIDYKTGKFMNWATSQKYTMETLKDSIQPRMYHYVMSKKYPGQQIVVTMLYINDGGPYSIYYDKQDVVITENLLRKYYETIKTATPVCHKSWKCTKFCEFGKTNFEDTTVKPLLRNGAVMTKCQQMEYVLGHKSEQDALKHMANGVLQENLDAYQQG